MTPGFAVWVPGDPKGQPRARARPGGGGVYDPASADEWKGRIRLAVREVHAPHGPVHKGPVQINCTWWFRRPKTGRPNRKKDSDGRIPHIIKPDRDNLDKAVLDALSHCNLWRDDCQAQTGHLAKWYVARDYRLGRTEPGVDLFVRLLEPYDP